MLLVCSAAAMNLIYGLRPYHYALAIFAALMGGGAAIRQILLHICPGFPTFGIPFWGLNLYTWSFVTFVCSSSLFFEKKLSVQASSGNNPLTIRALVLMPNLEISLMLLFVSIIEEFSGFKTNIKVVLFLS